MPGFDQPTPINAGRILAGRYRLVAPIAHGGMAEVWEALDDVLSRPVAVKVLRQHLAHDGVFVERFRREAVTAAGVAHSGVVATFDAGVDEGTAFIVMELVRGRTLRQLLTESGRLEPWLAVAIARQIADALASAHQAGLVHRDIKPANVLLVDDEFGGLRVKVTDFGIAKAGSGVGNDLTRTGTVLGTPKYLSPEQIKGRDPDARADLYSLGVLLYEMLTGEAPFIGDTDMATAMAHLNQPVPRTSAKVRGLPPGLSKLVSDLLAKEPDRRIPSALELRHRLDELGPLAPPDSGRRSSPPPPPPPRPPRESVPAERGRSVPMEIGSVAASSPTSVLGGRLPPPEGTVALGTLHSGPSTDELVRPPSPVHRNGRIAGIVVLVLVGLGALVAGILLATQPGHPRAGGGTSTTISRTSPATIGSVSVFMLNGGSPDNPNRTPLAFDGNPSTFWSTDKYSTPTFGNLYPGLGLIVSLKTSAKLHRLTVTSPTSGWAASTYVSTTAISSGQPLSAWGQPTDTKTGLAPGSTTYDLGSRDGGYVLLWITNLGPGDQVEVSELSVS